MSVGMCVVFLLGLYHFSKRIESAHTNPAESALERLHAACVQDMVASTCTVMKSEASKTQSKPGDVVFVAGVGPIDAATYQQLYAAGDAMCEVVRDACAKNWAAGQCLTARKLYGF